jgi:hypothetical protein
VSCTTRMPCRRVMRAAGQRATAVRRRIRSRPVEWASGWRGFLWRLRRGSGLDLLLLSLAPASLSGLSLLAVIGNAATDQKYPVLLECVEALFERMEQGLRHL